MLLHLPRSGVQIHPAGGFEPNFCESVSRYFLVEFCYAGKVEQTIYMQNTQTLVKHTRDTVEILVSPMLIQTGKPDEAKVTTDQAYIIAS